MSEQYFVDKELYDNLSANYSRAELEVERLNNIIDTLKIEISSLMGKYFYEKEFYIEDTDLDKLLRIIDGDIETNELKEK